MAVNTLSNYLTTALINLTFRGVSFTPPTTFYIGLFTTPPTLAGTGGVEVSATSTGYARVSVPQATWLNAPDSNNNVTNASQITFGSPTANWGNITHACVYDAASGGNLMAVFALATAKTVNAGDSAPTIPVGSLRIQPVT